MSDSESETSFLYCPCPACAIEGVKSLIWKGWGSSDTKRPPKHHIGHSGTAVPPKNPAHGLGRSASEDTKKQVLNVATGASTQGSAKKSSKDTPKKRPSKPSTGTPPPPPPHLARKELLTKNTPDTAITVVVPTKDPVESAPKAALKHNSNIKFATFIPIQYPIQSAPQDSPEHNPDITAAPIITESTQGPSKLSLNAPKSNPDVAVAPTQGQLKFKATLDEFAGHNSGPEPPHTRDPDEPGSRSPVPAKKQALDPSAGNPINHVRDTQDQQVKSKMGADPITTYPTEDECLTRLRKHIAEEKKDLADNFFKNGLTDFGDGVTKMVSSLIDAGCLKREIAKDLSVLTLYDLVIFIDDSPSMGSKVNEEILTNTLNEICKIYSLANKTGIKAVRYLNHRQGKGNVGLTDVKEVIRRCAHTGVTRIGTELHRRVLGDLVLNPKVPMIKPLLIMIVTDGTVEGESETLLPKVIINCVATLKKGGRSHQSVAFQFCRIGNDPEAVKFLKELDDHPKLGDHIDCLSEYFHLENIADDDKWAKERWNVMCKLLLGPIIPHWDNYDRPVDEDDLEGDGTLDLRDEELVLEDD